MPDENNNPYQPIQYPYEQPYQSQSPYDQQPFLNDEQPFQGAQQYPQQPYQQAYEDTQPNSNVTLLIIFSVISFFFCGIFSVIPLIFSFLAYSAYSTGDIATGNERAKIAKISLIALLVLVILVVLLIAIFFGVLSLMAVNN